MHHSTAFGVIFISPHVYSEPHTAYFLSLFFSPNFFHCKDKYHHLRNDPSSTCRFSLCCSEPPLHQAEEAQVPQPSSQAMCLRPKTWETSFGPSPVPPLLSRAGSPTDRHTSPPRVWLATFFLIKSHIQLALFMVSMHHWLVWCPS